MSEFKELTALLFRLREKSKNSYLAYIDQCNTDEFLGAETKIRQGTFGHLELIAHTAAAERLGRNWAFSRAAEMITEVLREMGEIGPTQEVNPIKTDFDSRPMSEKWEVGSMVKARNNSEFESFLYYPTISQSITNLGQKLLNDQLIRDRAIIACANVCQTVTDSGMFDAHQQYASAHCRDEIMKLSTGISVGEDGEDVGSIDELT